MAKKTTKRTKAKKVVKARKTVRARKVVRARKAPAARIGTVFKQPITALQDSFSSVMNYFK